MTVIVLKIVQPITTLIYNNRNALSVLLVVLNVTKPHAYPVWMTGRLILKEDVFNTVQKSVVQVYNNNFLINQNFKESFSFTDQYFDGGLCKSCHSTCETCDGPTEHACLSCSSPLMLQGSRCVAECERGTFHDKRLHTCQPCLHTCASCLSKTNCTECSSGLQVSCTYVY